MIKPLSNKVVVEPVIEEKKTESGIVLPDSVSESRLVRGTVIAVGPGEMDNEGKRKPMSVKEGDAILFKKGYSADEIEIDGKRYILLSEDEILGVF